MAKRPKTPDRTQSMERRGSSSKGSFVEKLASSATEQVRLGRGTVARVTIAFVMLLVLFIVAAWRRPPTDSGDTLVIVAAVVFVLYLVGVIWFANKNPDAALLEGAELIRMRELKLAAKGRSKFKQSEERAVPEPTAGDLAQLTAAAPKVDILPDSYAEPVEAVVARKDEDDGSA